MRNFISEKKKKITLVGLILVIFSSIYGCSSSLATFYQMDYASIIWYILTAALFFLSSALMFVEYGTSFKAAEGGIFPWLRGSVGEKSTFINTFIWLAAWVIRLISSTQFFLVLVAATIFGKDTTASWHLFGLPSDQALGISEITFLVLVCSIVSKGISGTVRISSTCEMATLGISVVFIVVSLIILMMQHGQLAEPLTTVSLVKSPSSSFTNPFAVVSFIVYALFAYDGLETMTGVINSVEKPEKAFPRGLIWVVIMMTVLYISTIFLCGVTANWSGILGQENANLANVGYVLIDNTGLVFDKIFGLGHAQASILGKVFSQVTAISDVLGGLGAAFVMLYSPTKSFIEGCDRRLLPRELTTLDKYDMPEFAMWYEVIFVSLIILLTSLGGSSAGAFYIILTDMINVSSAAPYLFLIGTFPLFKMRKDLDRPLVFYQSQKYVWVVITSGVIFTIIEPIVEDDPAAAFWTAFGPVFFSVVAWIFHSRAGKKIKDL